MQLSKSRSWRKQNVSLCPADSQEQAGQKEASGRGGAGHVPGTHTERLVAAPSRNWRSKAEVRAVQKEVVVRGWGREVGALMGIMATVFCLLCSRCSQNKFRHFHLIPIASLQGSSYFHPRINEESETLENLTLSRITQWSEQDSKTCVPGTLRLLPVSCGEGRPAKRGKPSGLKWQDCVMIGWGVRQKGSDAVLRSPSCRTEQVMLRAAEGVLAWRMMMRVKLSPQSR